MAKNDESLPRFFPIATSLPSPQMHPPLIIKLGGSILTDKSTENTLSPPTIVKPLVDILSTLSFPVIIIHGAGSFGHPQAHAARLCKTPSHKADRIGISRTRQAVRRLNGIVVGELVERQVPAVGISPGTLIHTVKSGEYDFAGMLRHVESLLQGGFVPVLHGDVIITRLGSAILSGDTLVSVCASHFRPRGCVFVTDVEGVYTSDPRKGGDAKLVRRIYVGEDDLGMEMWVSEEGRTRRDVTGGMRGKVLCAMDIVRKCGVEKVDIVKVLSEDMKKVLLGEEFSVGTTVVRRI